MRGLSDVLKIRKGGMKKIIKEIYRDVLCSDNVAIR